MDKTPSGGAEAESYCQLKCTDTENLSKCMENCFQTIGGAGAIKVITIPLGIIALIILIGWAIVEYDGFMKYRKRKTEQD